MEKKNKQNTIFTIVSLLIVVWLFYFFDNASNDNSGIAIEYDTEISGIVSNATNSRGATSIWLLKPREMKYHLNTTSNYDYKPNYFLSDFAQGGDSIYKPAYSDTLYIFRGNRRYFFIINKSINFREQR